MTDRESKTLEPTRAQTAGIGLAFLFILSCFFGYQIGADLARNDNAREAAARSAG